MKDAEDRKEEKVSLAKLKAYLERSRLEYTETVNGNSTVMEIRRIVPEEERGGEDNGGSGIRD